MKYLMSIPARHTLQKVNILKQVLLCLGHNLSEILYETIMYNFFEKMKVFVNLICNELKDTMVNVVFSEIVYKLICE